MGKIGHRLTENYMSIRVGSGKKETERYILMDKIFL